MSKFKVGDEVRCINPSGMIGAGWVEGKIFIINKIIDDIYWPTGGGSGVYEDTLELTKVTNWRNRIQNG